VEDFALGELPLVPSHNLPGQLAVGRTAGGKRIIREHDGEARGALEFERLAVERLADNRARHEGIVRRAFDVLEHHERHG
jgi:hypothetical protein